MTAPDDLIRRGDVLKIVFPDACSEALKGALCLHPSCDDVRYSPILDAIRALPTDPVLFIGRTPKRRIRADPVAEAAGKRIAELEAAVSDAMVVIADMAPGETVLIDRLRALLAKGGAA